MIAYQPYIFKWYSLCNARHPHKQGAHWESTSVNCSLECRRPAIYLHVFKSSGPTPSSRPSLECLIVTLTSSATVIAFFLAGLRHPMLNLQRIL